MRDHSELQDFLLKQKPKVPHILQEIGMISFTEKDKTSSVADAEEIKKSFPKTFGRGILQVKSTRTPHASPLRVGVVFSGGQASGGHNVITGLFDTLKKISSQSALFGFLDGPGGIVEGKSKEITEGILAQYRNQGGFDLLGSGRTKIETPEQFKASLDACNKLNLDGLVIIGGDDSNTNAAFLAEYFLTNHSKTRVVGVPKTIDGDLKNEYIATSFGFDTACKVYSEMIGNIARDALSAKKYYHFIKLMGRSASHIALECALKTHPNVTLLGEEVFEKKQTLKEIVNAICDVICERAKKGKHYGIILIPEGLIEFIPEIGHLIKELSEIIAKGQTTDPVEITKALSRDSKECFNAIPHRIQNQLLLDRDPHGNVQVSRIETERLLIQMVERELKGREVSGAYKNHFNALEHFFGYEGRSGFPSNFDANYCYALGITAALLVREEKTGYISCIQNLTKPVSEWMPLGLPITMLMNLEERKGKKRAVIQKALVDLKSKAYHDFVRMRKVWEVEDHYQYPGPIQYFGPEEISERGPIVIL